MIVNCESEEKAVSMCSDTVRPVKNQDQKKTRQAQICGTSRSQTSSPATNAGVHVVGLALAALTCELTVLNVARALLATVHNRDAEKEFEYLNDII
jgi:hypothetical protein